MSSSKDSSSDASKDSSAHATQHTHKQPMCGGVSGLRPVNEEDLKVWDTYKEHLEKQIQDQFHVSKSYTLKPVQVSTQVVAGQNYFFKVELPEKKYATARVYHVPWQKDSHGKADHVAVHAKLADNFNDDVGHF